jgi:hypothetical protein
MEAKTSDLKPFLRKNNTQQTITLYSNITSKPEIEMPVDTEFGKSFIKKTVLFSVWIVFSKNKASILFIYGTECNARRNNPSGMMAIAAIVTSGFVSRK